MRKVTTAILIAGLGAFLAACNDESTSPASTNQASNRAMSTASDSNTGIQASAVCNGNPDAGTVGSIDGIIDNNNASTYFGAISTKSDKGGNLAGQAVVDCVVTINFGSQIQSADYVNVDGEVIGTWWDAYSDFYYYQALHAVTDVYTLNSSGQKTLITSQQEHVSPYCIGKILADPDRSKCAFTLSAGSATNNLSTSVAGVEFNVHFYTLTSESRCFANCMATLEPRISGIKVVKSGVEILSSGS